MGQCMPTALHDHLSHPTLGLLRVRTDKRESRLSLALVVRGEEDYIEWSKKINKLRFNH